MSARSLHNVFTVRHPGFHEVGSSSVGVVALVATVAIGGGGALLGLGHGFEAAIGTRTAAGAHHATPQPMMGSTSAAASQTDSSEPDVVVLRLPTSALPSSALSTSTLSTSAFPTAHSTSTSSQHGQLNPAPSPSLARVAARLGISTFGNSTSGMSLAFGAQTSEHEDSASTELSASQVAARRGELYIEMQANLENVAAVYANADLDAAAKEARVAELSLALQLLQDADQRLAELQRPAILEIRSGVLLSAFAFAAQNLLDPTLAEVDGETLHDKRFGDREALSGLLADRAARVAEIEGLHESGASLDQYLALQGQLAELDGAIGELLDRDGARAGQQLENGALIVLPVLSANLAAVGPDPSDHDAVRAFLRSKVAVTADHLQAIMPNLPRHLAEAYEPLVNTAMEEAQINTPARRAAFLAQLAHESIGLTAFEELASGAAYEWRTDLGNVNAGDGRRYKGRGPIQLTGRANYRSAGHDLGIDLEGNPELAAQPEIGFRVAAWYWETRGLNELADAGNFDRITYKINGGYNGASDRIMYWERAKGVLH